MKRYFFRILLAGLALPFSGISQNTANPGAVDTAGRGNVRGADSSVSLPKQDQAGNLLTLKECVDLAIKNNLLVQTAQTTKETNGVNARQAKDYMLPTLNGSASQSENYGRSVASSTNTYVDQQNGNGNYGLSAGLLLFNGFFVQHNIRQSVLSYDASKLDLQYQKDQITLNVILNYVLVLSSQDQLAIARHTAEVDSLSVVRLRIEDSLGAVAPSDLSDLQGNYAADQAAVTNLEYGLEANKVALFSYLNVPYQRDAAYEQINPNTDIGQLGSNSDSIFQTALQIVPSIRANDLRVRSAREYVAAQRGKYYPSLSAAGSIGSNFSTLNSTVLNNTAFEQATGTYVKGAGGVQNPVFGTNFLSKQTPFSDQFPNNRNESIGLTLSVPILNYLQTRNNVRLAKINLEVQKNNATASKNQLQQNVELAWQNLRAAYNLYQEYSDQVKAYAKSFHAADVKFRNGAITSVDYIIVKNKYDQATVNLAASKYTFIFRQRILDYYQGNLKW